ncbi:MAG: adenylate/guanylate cyclase domain-containing protein [Nitrospinota bacterium]
MAVCTQCGYDNRKEALFCRHCGTGLSRACPACGQENLLDARYCDRCGTRLDSESAATAAGGQESVAKPPGGGYTPRHIQALLGAAALQGERKEVAVLFADVSGFTRFSEGLDAEDVHAIMNGCFEILTGEVHRFGGTVNQYTGDGIMALFGAPRALETSPRDAIGAALAAQERLDSYAAGLQRERDITFKVRIGLNSGEVVVGAIGDDLRLDYTAMGDTTNVAARLQAAAEPGEILITADLHRLTGEWFRFEDMGELSLRGKGHPVRVYRVLGPSGVSTRLEAASLRGLLRLRERDGVLESLLGIFAEVQGGRGQIAAISGEAGAGKSRVVYELKKSFESGEIEPPLFVSAGANRHDKNAPLSLLREILRNYSEAADAYCSVEAPGRETIWQETLTERAGDLLRDAEKARSIAALVERMEGGEGGSGPADPQPALDVLRTLFLLESRERPVVLAIDNLLDADRSSIEFLNALASGIAGARILFLPVYRPGFEHPWAVRSNYHHITLPPLSRGATEEMIEELLAGPVSEEVMDAVYSRAGGNPFFTEEMVRGVRESGGLVIREGEWRLRSQEMDFVLPRTVQDFVLARLDALPGRLREVLQAASIIGLRFESGLLGGILADSEDLEARLDKLQEMELLYPAGGLPDGEWNFKDRLIQELTYKEMLRSRRAQLHERAGTAIEGMGEAAIEENLDRLAFHFSRSDALDRAASYLIRAGRRAYALLALPQAAAKLEQGLIFMESKGEEKGREFLSERIRVRGDLALALLGLGAEERRIESLLGEMNEMAEAAGDREQVAMSFIHMCTLRFRMGDQSAVIGYAKRAIETVEGRDTYEPLFRGHFALASAYRVMGRLAESIEEAEEAISIYEEHLAGSDSDTPDLIHVAAELMGGLGISNALRGDIARSEEMFRCSEGIAEREPVMGLRGSTQFFKVFLFETLGQWNRMMEHLETIREELAGIQFPHAEAALASYLGMAYIRLADPQKGLGLIESAIEKRFEIGQKLFLALDYLFRAEALSTLGRPDEALESCRTGIGHAEKSGGGLVGAQLFEMEARIECEAADEGELEDRIGDYEAALSRIEEMEMTPALARGRRRLAGYLRRAGEDSRAAAMEDEVRVYLHSIGAADAEEAPAARGAIGA